jgi:hypothetical protein
MCFHPANFSLAGIQWFGPSRKAATIASCPIEANLFMQKYNIPTAECGIYTDYGSSQLCLNDLPENLEYADCNIERSLRDDMIINGLPSMAITMTGLSKTTSGESYLKEICVPPTKRAAHEFARKILGAKNKRLVIRHNPDGIQMKIISHRWINLLLLPACYHFQQKSGMQQCLG